MLQQHRQQSKSREEVKADQQEERENEHAKQTGKIAQSYTKHED